jgi:hypothetical protein
MLALAVRISILFSSFRFCQRFRLNNSGKNTTKQGMPQA